MNRNPSLLSVVFRLWLLMAMLLPALPLQPALAASQPMTSPAPEAPAATNTIKIVVVSARDEPLWGAPLGDPNPPGILKGDVIASFNYLINLDNVGDPFQVRYPACSPYMDPPTNTIRNTNYPDSCKWPSIEAQNGYSPIITQGNQDDFNGVNGTGLTLPDGKYLVSATADEFKIDGQWFTIPYLDASGIVTVTVQPLPLPTGTIRVRVFEDNAIVNSAPDIPSERGLEGFAGHVADQLGEVSTDVYGNPICTQYEPGSGPYGYAYADGAPVPIPGTGGQCLSDANGDIVIPNMGPNRYEVTVIPPDGQNWIQTTTLEGNRGWDTWVQEGYTGFDTEFTLAGEPFPFTIFGFVQPTTLTGTTDTPVTGLLTITGEIKGVVASVQVYVPYSGGVPYIGNLWGGLGGAKIETPVDRPWVALTDLQRGDTAVYVGEGNPDGSFSIKHIPDGNYTFTYWDGPQMHLLDLFQVTVRNGEVVDLGVVFLTRWFSKVYGHVFSDDNGNGHMDPGEHGIEGYPLAVKRRENSIIDRAATGTVSGPDGSYVMENIYPLTQWIILEGYSDSYYVTGLTFQATNQPTETTVLGNGVDINYLTVIGQGGRLDWGVRPYEKGHNGGIVGSVVYDTTRNELDPRYAATEGWSTGIPNLTVNLYATVKDAQGNFIKEADGSLMKGAWLNTATTEQWARPKNCQARDADGNPVNHQVLPPAAGGYDCLEAPLTGAQFEPDFAAVDGNYGFGTIISPSLTATVTEEIPVPLGDYLVEVVIPTDTIKGNPLYQVTKEEDINVFNGDSYVPQPASPDIPPSFCAGPLHTVHVTNQAFLDNGGSPFEGQDRPLCNIKMVTVSDQRSIAPMFHLFTPVPIPGRWYGYIVDDLNIATNPRDLLFGEKAGVPNSPIGVYDYSNRLVTTLTSDPNGIFEVLLPSTDTINCPSPTGICANLFRIVGNDPGQPGRVNPNYNPAFRTIAATFEIWPGQIVPADLAPTQVGVSIQAPGSQFNQPVICEVAGATPQLFSVDKPYVRLNTNTAARTITIQGIGFGARTANSRVLLENVAVPDVFISGWSDRVITVTVPNTTTVGARTLQIRNDSLETLTPALTLHVIGGTYTPTILEVGPGKTYSVIQDALEIAADNYQRALVVVYPGTPQLWNPRGAYFENLIIHSPVKLQGVGPGGVYTDTMTYVPGSILDGSLFSGDTQLIENWRALLDTITWVGNQNLGEGAVITLLAESNNQYNVSGYRAAIDGFTIQGGNQQGFPNNINQIGGGQNGLPPNVVIQGGGIYANTYIKNLSITNNVLQSNGGAYGGAIRIGTPDYRNANNKNDSQNLSPWIIRNRIIANGGTNLAGGIGIFGGAANYIVSLNNICGNFSAEYGGGISHYGYSNGGQISNNRIYFNRSYDEGGGIMIAGELPTNPATTLSDGAGAVSVFSNIIQGNLSNDDGGGIRFLMAGPFAFNVYNNFIVNNISTHEGGGISLNDAPFVNFYNNTVIKNLTTATAITSNGQRAPAGLATSANSLLLMAKLRQTNPNADVFSKPLMFNNIFWDNRAGTWDGYALHGLGLQGDTLPVDIWDLGVSDYTGVLSVTYSTLTATPQDTVNLSHPSNKFGDPAVRSSYDLSVNILPWRTNPRFVNVNIVAVEQAPTLMGDYHLKVTSRNPLTSPSPAFEAGVAGIAGVAAPPQDIDGDTRPRAGKYDIGADQIGPLSGYSVVLPGDARSLLYPFELFITFINRLGQE